MKRMPIALIVLGLLIVAATIGAGCTNAPVTNATLAQTTVQTPGTLRTPVPLAPDDALTAVAPGIQAALDRLDSATAKAAVALGPTEMAGDEARAILRNLSRVSPAAIDATAVSRDGVMLTVEPAEYASAEGADISGQEQVQRLRETRQPVMSGVFKTVEGVNATDLEHPVFSSGGQFNGSASLLFNPTTLLNMAVPVALSGKSAEVFVMDTDGLVLYDRDAAEVGKNTFTDPLFAGNEELQAIAKRMQTEPEGTGSYTFAAEGSSAPVRKEIAWTSVGLHGTEWRVVATNATPSI